MLAAIPRATVPYIETFVGRQEVILTCQFPEQKTVPRINVTHSHVVFADMGLKVELPVSVMAGEMRATFVNGTIDLHLRRRGPR